MGPQTNVCGRLSREKVVEAAAKASMGPQTNVCGRFTLADTQVHDAGSFNGAADKCLRKVTWRKNAGSPFASLQWGRRQMSAEGPPTTALQAALFVLQWGRRQMSAEGASSHTIVPSASTGFNGAADKCLRKVRSPCVTGRSDRVLQWGRRQMSAEGLLALEHDGTLRDLLQWGRRQMSAEGRGSNRSRRQSRPASMGPQTNVCGR